METLTPVAATYNEARRYAPENPAFAARATDASVCATGAVGLLYGRSQPPKGLFPDTCRAQRGRHSLGPGRIVEFQLLQHVAFGRCELIGLRCMAMRGLWLT